MEPASLQAWCTDGFVILCYFAAIFAIGLYMGRKQDSLESYALGNRSLPWWAILASILASEISAATFFGTPEAGFKTLNFTYAQLCIGTILGRIVVGKAVPHPTGDVKLEKKKEKELRKKYVLKALELLQSPVDGPTVVTVDS